MLELYAAYWDVSDMMEFNEALDRASRLGRDRGRHRACPTATARSRSRARSRAIEYFEAMARYSDGKYTRERLLDPAGAQSDSATSSGCRPRRAHGHALDKIFERVLEPHLIEPTFVTGYPVADLAAGQTTGGRSGARRSLRALLRAHGDFERLYRAQRSRRSAGALRSASRRTQRRATKRFRNPIGTSCARSNTACRRPPESASASTGSSCC